MRPLSLDYIDHVDRVFEPWQREAHYWDFEDGVVDQVGHVEATTRGDVWINQIDGMGTVLDFSTNRPDSYGAVQFPQGLGDGVIDDNYSVSFWFMLTSLEDQVIYDQGDNGNGSRWCCATEAISMSR